MQNQFETLQYFQHFKASVELTSTPRFKSFGAIKVGNFLLWLSLKC